MQTVFILYVCAQRRSRAEMQTLVARIAPILGQSVGNEGMLVTPFLPRPFCFSSGLRVTVRDVRPDDVELVYNMWTLAASKGQHQKTKF